MPRFGKSYLLMSIAATLLIILSAGSAARAEVCPPTSPISLHSDEPFDLQVFFDLKPAMAIRLHLYAGAKLVHSAIADRTGRVRLGLLPEGEYRVVIPGKGTLAVTVLRQRSGLNGDMISWFLYPKSKYKWVAGQQVAGSPCPLVMLKAD